MAAYLPALVPKEALCFSPFHSSRLYEGFSGVLHNPLDRPCRALAGRWLGIMLNAQPAPCIDTLHSASNICATHLCTGDLQWISASGQIRPEQLRNTHRSIFSPFLRTIPRSFEHCSKQVTILLIDGLFLAVHHVSILILVINRKSG